ncbi:MAG: ribose 5-phosphate isomerase B [Planctomycetota bacterium]
MRVAIGADHAGYKAKQRAIEALQAEGVEVDDVGTHSEASCDYPDYALEVAQRVGRRQADWGVLICGTGIGMSITANKVPGVRAACVHNDFTCELARRHNDANVLCMGARVLEERQIQDLIQQFLHTPFQGGRHSRRVRKIEAIDRAR